MQGRSQADSAKPETEARERVEPGAGAGPTRQELEAQVARLKLALAERGQEVEELRAREMQNVRVRAIADALPMLISYVGADHRYRYLNRAYQTWFGVDRRELVGRHLRDVLGATAYAKLLPMVDRALAGEPVRAELPVEYAQGAPRHIRLAFMPDHDSEGRVAGYFELVEDISERQRADRKLRESEMRFRTMADSAPAPVWVTGPGGIEFVNRAFGALAGRHVREIRGESWTDMIHPDEVGQVLQLRADAWEARAPYQYAARFRRADGEWRWMHVACNPRIDEAGELAGYVGMAVDLTEQKRAEAELRESEARFRDMADGAPAPVWVTDRIGIVFANRALRDFTGRELDSLVGDGWRSIIHPDDLPVLARIRDSAWEDQSPYRFEARFRRHDGEWRWLRASASPRGQEGRFAGYVGVAVDVTESRRAEQELRESEALLRTMFDHAGLGLMLVDRDLRILRANPALAGIIGRTQGELVGRSCLELTHEEDMAISESAFAAMRSGAEGFAVEQRYVGPSGDPIWVRLTLSQVDDRILALVEDVTARLRAEDALRELNQSLEQRIESAIAERRRVEEALRHAQKMEAVGQLTGGIAHDFNNLLTVIGGNLDLAARRLGEGTDPRVARAIANATTGAHRAAALTQRLLAFSRRQPLAPKPIDPNHLLVEMTELLHRTLGETVRVETRLAAGVPQIEADPHQLESALLNLAVNARDAMPDGGTLVLETRTAEIGQGEEAGEEPIEPGAYSVLSVRDNGSGMDEETLVRSIEPFFTTKEVGKGTGLGLSMVYGFVRQSGGHVRIESRVGEGTDIHLFFPCRGAAGESERPAEPGPLLRGDGGEIVLVCEDDADVRFYSVELLRELGYQVLEAEDAASTLRILADPDVRVDLLFTDVVLPGGTSGVVLARQARQLRAGLPILFTTGYARDAILQGARLEAGIELLPKPFSPADLAARIREMLKPGE